MDKILGWVQAAANVVAPCVHQALDHFSEKVYEIKYWFSSLLFC